MSLHQYHYFDEGAGEGVIFTRLIKAPQPPNLVAVKPKMKVSYLCLAAPQILISALLPWLKWHRAGLGFQPVTSILMSLMHDRCRGEIIDPLKSLAKLPFIQMVPRLCSAQFRLHVQYPKDRSSSVTTWRFHNPGTRWSESALHSARMCSCNWYPQATAQDGQIQWGKLPQKHFCPLLLSCCNICVTPTEVAEVGK